MMVVKLKVQAGPVKGKEFVFDQHDAFIFGRAPKCHCCIPNDPYVSRNHFLLEANPPECKIRDLGSLNGTHVNGRKYGGREQNESPEQAARRTKEVSLKHGDVVQTGDTQFLVCVEGPAECVDCGKRIPEEQKQEAAFLGGAYLCAECREKAARKHIGAVLKPRCSKCGREISATDSEAAQDTPLCHRCRAAQPDAGHAGGDLLARIVAQAMKGKQAIPAVPDYEIVRELGEGGMGKVYLARQRKDAKEVALKVMLSRNASPLDKDVQRFQREMKICQQLKHPHVVAFLHQGRHKGIFYFVMEYCDGGNLRDLMKKRGGAVPLDEAGPIMLQALDGLAYAHGQKVVHRDLKPENVLLVRKGRQHVAKVADFGLAKNFQQSGLSGMTLTGTYAGTVPFMPHEQIEDFRHAHPATDVFSIGATFYNLLTGQYVYDFSAADDPMKVVLEAKVVPIRKRGVKLPAELVKIIDRATAPEPGDRFKTAGEMKTAMEKALPGGNSPRRLT